MRVCSRVTVLLAGLSLIPCAVISQPDNADKSSPGVILSSNTDGLLEEILYHQSNFLFQKSNDPSNDYCRIIIPGLHFTSETGKPELPVFSQLISVPAGTMPYCSLSDIQTSIFRLADFNMKGRQIYPSQPPRAKNLDPDEKVVFKDKKLYRNRGPIGHDTVLVTKVGRFRGNDLYNIALYPVFYNPSGKSVDLITSVKVNIGYSSSETKGNGSSVFPEPKGSSGGKAYITGYSDKPVRMIIITDPSFSKAIRPLIHWKTMKGIKITTIFRGSGTDDEVYQDLKHSLDSVYQAGLSENNPPQYLLIIGGPGIIPKSAGTTNVSDLYYGEMDGNGDYVPDIFTGRLPVTDTIQLKAMVKKIIDYENYNYQADNNFWSGALVTAGNDAGYAAYMNGQVNYVFSNYFNTIPSVDGHKWMYPESPTKDDSLKTLINNGLGILNYTGHGESGGLADPSLKAADVANLTNINKYPLIIANACRTAQISVSPCFGTKIVTASDAGAIGYIGCTNDSFWSEDFYWAVGPGTPNLTATYENTGLGAFDRLYHTHGEEPGDWYYTLGQINFAGNLSVSSSTSSKKKYYWETYMLLGDPSLSPYLCKPDTFSINIPDTLPQALTELNFISKPFGYAAISNFDTIWDARFISPSGNVSLAIPGGVKDSCLLVVTGQNMVPYIKTIHFGNLNDEFLTAGSFLLDDAEGNNNNLPDYGERIKLRMTVRNLGLSDATGLTASLQVASGMLTVEQGIANIGALAAGGSYTINNDFVFKVSDVVPDGEIASLTLTLADAGHTFTYGIDMVLYAPDIKIISSVPDDLAEGNGNYLPDPGENIDIKVRVINQGSSAVTGTLSLTEDSPLIDLASDILPTGILSAGSEKVIAFNASVSSFAKPGDIIPYNLSLSCGGYSASGKYSLSTGKTRETWEHSRFDIFPWLIPAQYPWTITSSSSYENVLSARSALMPDNNESILAISVNNPVKDTISFYSRVSTEDTYDHFIFRIDSVSKIKMSGEHPWGKNSLVLEPGIHYLEWVYKKDFSQTGGFDAVWIDMITFPDIAFLDADLKIDTVFAPPDTAVMNDIVIKGRVVNLGRYTLTSFPLSFRINEDDPVDETFYQKIDPGDTLDFAFSRHLTFLTDVDYKIEVTNKLPEDGYAGNNVAYAYFRKSGSDYYGSLFAYPSPFNDKIDIIYEAIGDGTVMVEIADMQGRVVMKRQATVIEGMNRVSLEGLQPLASGVYSLRVIEGRRILSRKVVKAR